MFRQLANGHQQITLYGAGGEKLSVYDLTTNTTVATYVWFGGKLISDGNPVYQARLGTNRASGGSTTTNNGARFLPYGDEVTSTANDHVKFGTYARDSYTGLDYADQRFYASTYGRFNTPDPYMASGAASGSTDNPNDPVSWNRYAYTGGDPVNRLDPIGDDWCDATNTNLYFDGFLSTSTGCGNWGGGLAGYFPDIALIISNSVSSAVAAAQTLSTETDGSDFGSGPANCAVAIAKVIAATLRVEGRIADIMAVGGAPDKGHAKALAEAVSSLKNALGTARRSCSALAAAAAAAAIAAGEAAAAAGEAIMAAAAVDVMPAPVRRPTGDAPIEQSPVVRDPSIRGVFQ